MPEEEIIAEQPSAEAPPEAQPPETPALEVPETPSQPPVEYATAKDLAEFRERLDHFAEGFETLRTDLSGKLADGISRVKQSSRDSIAEFRKEYLATIRELDEAVKAGQADANYVVQRKQALRDEFDRKALEAEQTPQEQPVKRGPDPEALQYAWQTEWNRAMKELGLNANDPEFQELRSHAWKPEEDGSPPVKELWRVAGKVAQKKAQRLADEQLGVKRQERQEQKVAQQKQAAAQQKAVIVDTNAGTAAPKPPTVEEMQAELDNLLDKPEVRDFEKHKAWQKKVDELTAKIGGAS